MSPDTEPLGGQIELALDTLAPNGRGPVKIPSFLAVKTLCLPIICQLLIIGVCNDVE